MSCLNWVPTSLVIKPGSVHTQFGQYLTADSFISGNNRKTVFNPDTMTDYNKLVDLKFTHSKWLYKANSYPNNIKYLYNYYL